MANQNQTDQNQTSKGGMPQTDQHMTEEQKRQQEAELAKKTGTGGNHDQTGQPSQSGVNTGIGGQPSKGGHPV
jgi:hypothetical protein